MPDPSLVYDVAVVGAGPAGSATAIALRHAGVPRVALLNRMKPSNALGFGESAAPAVGTCLKKLGLGYLVEAPSAPHRPYLGNLSAWGSDQLSHEDFVFRLTGHGWHLDRPRFDADLRASAVAVGCHPFLFHAVADIQRSQAPQPSATGSTHWVVRLSNQTKLHASVIVDATGRRSLLSRCLGRAPERLDRLIGLAVHAPAFTPSALAGRSFIESTPYGWWYAALLPSGQLMVTLMTDDDLARQMGLYEPVAYAQALQQTKHLSPLIGLASDHPAKPVSVSAASQFSPQVVGAGWIAVGDAMIGFDPLTSSGIAGALDDARAASETICSWFQAAPSQAVAAAKTYAHRANETLKRYLDEHKQHYLAEKRWSEQPFWKRRHQGLSPMKGENVKR